jgi:hypothetical protein
MPSRRQHFKVNGAPGWPCPCSRLRVTSQNQPSDFDLAHLLTGQPTAASIAPAGIIQTQLVRGVQYSSNRPGAETTGRCFVADPGSGSKHDPRAGSPG